MLMFSKVVKCVFYEGDVVSYETSSGKKHIFSIKSFEIDGDGDNVAIPLQKDSELYSAYCPQDLELVTSVNRERL